MKSIVATWTARRCLSIMDDNTTLWCYGDRAIVYNGFADTLSMVLLAAPVCARPLDKHDVFSNQDTIRSTFKHLWSAYPL